MIAMTATRRASWQRLLLLALAVSSLASCRSVRRSYTYLQRSGSAQTPAARRCAQVCQLTRNIENSASSRAARTMLALEVATWFVPGRRR